MFSMLLPHVYLREFIQPVPTCLETADLRTVFEAFGWNDRQSPIKDLLPDRLVLVDGQGCPTGLVRLSRLLPHLLRRGLVEQQPSLKQAGKSANLTDPAQRIEPSLVEPVRIWAGELTIEQFLLDCNAQVQADGVIIGDRGEYLGILDPAHLLRFLAIHLARQSAIQKDGRSQEISEPAIPEVSTHEASPRESDATRHQKTLSYQQRLTTRLAQQLLAQKEELTQQVKSQQETIHQLMEQAGKHQTVGLSLMQSQLPQTAFLSSPAGDPLPPLLQLLEQLPLPLMLQAGDGQVLAQNSVWQRQVEDWLDSDRIRQEMVNLLDAPTDASTQPADLLAKGGESGLTASWCHLGSKPGTCICSCPLKNGQEQVFQFVKIPVGSLASPSKSGAIATLPAPHPAPHTVVEEAVFAQPLCLASPTPAMPQAPVAPAGLVNPIYSSRSEPEPGQPASPPGSNTLWLVLAQDITEQQQLARELTAKNVDLIHLNRLKDEFLACISHELRTPLTAVLGLSSLLKDQTLGEMNQRQVHYAQLIYQSGRHLMAVVNDILDLTRMETGQFDLVSEPVDIRSVCSRAFEQAQQLRLLDEKQSLDENNPLPAFSLEVESGLETIVADGQRLRQMLFHLLSNALKFTEPDKQIGLRVNRWGGWIAFTVWDEGIGIPAEKQHLVFQKFQQLENPLTRRFEGTGLGLVLTQRLARLHGGDVSFLSKEGQGSQFTILLPPSPPGKSAIAVSRDELDPAQNIYPGGRVELNAPRPPAVPWHSVHQAPIHLNSLQDKLRQRLVLIVEAAPPFIETLTEQLIGLGYRVVIARSGTEALEKARRLQPCTIFLNPILPLLSGWDVLTLLKSSPETRQIPVVMMATKVDETHTHQNRADGWLSLPVQVKALRQTLGQLRAEPEDSVSPNRSSNRLTILRLSPGVWSNHQRAIATADLTHLFHSHHYHILEADDLEQAELLARVWKPNIVLLDGTPIDATLYFQQFSQQTFLSSLPLVTLNQETTQAANQMPGLLVFPCLAALVPSPATRNEIETSALLQVIQIAAGYAWRPSILALNLATLPATPEDALPMAPDQTLGKGLKEGEWLQALTQYLQTAGLRGLTGRCWQEVLQQVKSQSIDLLLICWTEVEPQARTLEMLSALRQLGEKPPILVLDHRDREAGNLQSPVVTTLPIILQQLATQILPPSLPMESLLKEIYKVLRG
ncbi:response regulator [Leptothermofonsia sichuanensis E412]|uniref:hybrid sensor histidine kinase/response regulator n=1 Tax=Leptothermofonsia sichuanensis TaxID=2917832 RepID=UPI001CA77A48|nr:hybrid sensor histidine kinase/response regulator [Leptothermofonsia sichuanensis]QZZ19630.1 response regulator [Leptothermofonsia sichuanensis E412]